MNHTLHVQLEFFTNASRYKNANIANFILAVPLENNNINEVYNLEIQFPYTHWHIISQLPPKQQTANFVCLWKTVAAIVQVVSAPNYSSINGHRTWTTICPSYLFEDVRILSQFYSHLMSFFE